jgi:hypothetical protein
MAIICDNKYNIINATNDVLDFLKYNKISEIRSRSITIIMPSASADFHTKIFEEMNTMTSLQVLDAKRLGSVNMNNDIVTSRDMLTPCKLEKALSKDSSIKELIRKDGILKYARIYIDFQHVNNTIIYIKPLSPFEEMLGSVKIAPTQPKPKPKPFHDIDSKLPSQIIKKMKDIKKIRNYK